MDQGLLSQLKEWRKVTAQKEGVELFRVLPNKTIESISQTKPQNKEELIKIKGIKEKKFRKYGKEILSMIKGLKPDISVQNNLFFEKTETKKPYTVSGYLNLLNDSLNQIKGRIQGEVTELNIRSGYLFFSLKDQKDESILRCFMWGRDYELCGLSLAKGMEIIVEGWPEVYKPSGSLTLRTSTVELVGEGALKRAYEELKKKLEKEGLFAVERKKILPEFVQKIGLITSSTGAVIHDFLNNLGKYGYKIKFQDSRVEGQIAVSDLISAIDYFANQEIDVLVIIRGGGSLESLQAFNNEALVRKIANFNVPVICGIGHDKDVPLSSLVSDLMVSTPTAVAIALNKSWEQAINIVQKLQKDILDKYQNILIIQKHRLEIIANNLISKFDFIFKEFDFIKSKINNAFLSLNYKLSQKNKDLNQFSITLVKNLKNYFEYIKNYLNNAEEKLKTINPLRQLELGYSIVSFGSKIVRSVREVKKGDLLDVRMSDGCLKTKVDKVNH